METAVVISIVVVTCWLVLAICIACMRGRYGYGSCSSDTGDVAGW